MNEGKNRSAAGLRPSVIAERIRLQQEWSALKGIDIQPISKISKKQNNVLRKRQDNIKVPDNDKNRCIKRIGCENAIRKPRFTRAMAETHEVLRGVVALVEVGAESRALALRAALTALGASVVPAWSPLVTHLIWSQGGCRSTRAKARALACLLVSPLWVEACAASGKRLLETTFPAAPRPSDLPSPKTLRRLLKKAEMENTTLADLLSDSKEDVNPVKPRLRISSETEHDSTADTSADMSHDETTAQSDVEARVNTAPRRALPASPTSPRPRPSKSRRKLFTHKEADLSKSSDNERDMNRTPAPPKPLTQRERRGLARAERMARRLVIKSTRAHIQTNAVASLDTNMYRIVLTGMSRTERLAAHNAVRTLNGRIQKQVNRKTTHVLLGSCREDSASPDKLNNTRNRYNEMHRLNQSEYVNQSNMASFARELAPKSHLSVDKMADGNNMAGRTDKVRTVNALLGAARGCRVLYAKWAMDSLAAKQWLHHYGYEVPHLRKITQKARVERHAIGRMRSEYAYDVFNGMRVRISPNAEQKDAIVQLLTLCGAVVQNGGTTQHCRKDGGTKQYDRTNQDGGRQYVCTTQNGRQDDAQNLFQQNGNDHDILIGVEDGEISSKWVFDSVAASRMRTARRYINKNIPESLTALSL